MDDVASNITYRHEACKYRTIQSRRILSNMNICNTFIHLEEAYRHTSLTIELPLIIGNTTACLQVVKVTLGKVQVALVLGIKIKSIAGLGGGTTS